MFFKSHSKFALALMGRAKLGFTLTELLVVMAVIATLSTVTIPLISSMRNATSLRKNLAELTGLLEQARQTAVSKNTYVYVGILSAQTTPSLPLVEPGTPVSFTAAFMSTDGSDVLGVSSTAAAESDGSLRLLNRVQQLRGLEVMDWLPAGNALSGTLDPRTASQPNDSWKLTAQSRSYSSLISPVPLVFDKVIKFTPQGAARVDQVPVEAVELVLCPSHGQDLTEGEKLQAAVIRISGLTGKITVYQPGQ